MPFILQCPYCKKYMILEDNQRGCRVRCLIAACAHWIDQEPSDSAERTTAHSATATPPPVPSAPPTAPETTAVAGVLVAERQKIVQCPNCKTHLRVPPGDRSRAIRCAKCQQVFDG